MKNRFTSFAKVVTIMMTMVVSGTELSFADDGSKYSKMSIYTSFLLKDYHDGVNSSRLAKAKSRYGGTEYLRAIIRLADESAWETIEAKGCRPRAKIGVRGTVDIPIDKVESLSELECVEFIQAARPLSLTLDSAVVKANVLPAYEGKGMEHPYTGKGVMVGALDWGFDLTHPTMYDSTGTTYRVKYYRDCATDKEYFGEENVKALGPTYKDFTHGTHVMGIAAGGGYNTPYRGVAYESEICLSETDKFSDATIIEAVKRTFEIADSLDMPCVVNLSLGGMTGCHDGSNESTLALDEMSGPGRIVVAAAGNNGNTNLHIVKEAGTDTLKTFSERSSTDNYIMGSTDKAEQDFEVSAFIADKEGNLLDSMKFYKASELLQSLKTDTVKVNDSTSVSYTIGSLLYKANKKYYFEINSNVLTGSGDDYHLGVKVVSEEGGVHFWTTGRFRSLGKKGFSRGNSDYTIGRPADGKNMIGVGSYDNRTNFTNLEGEITRYSKVDNPGELSYFSSKGPLLDGRIKPEVTAPGSNVISALNSYYTEGTKSDLDAMKKMTAYSSQFNGREYSWMCMSGTSMAAPFVTGSVALWLQANPTLSPDDIKEVIARTSIQDEDMEYPNNSWGYGKIDVYAGLLDILGIPSSVDELPILPDVEAVSLYNDAERGSFHVRWAKVPGAFSLNVYDAGGSPVATISVDDFQGVDYKVSLGNVLSGVYLVTITTDKGTVSRKVTL